MYSLNAVTPFEWSMLFIKVIQYLTTTIQYLAHSIVPVMVSFALKRYHRHSNSYKRNNLFVMTYSSEVLSVNVLVGIKAAFRKIWCWRRRCEF